MPQESLISLKNRRDPHQAKQNNRNVLIPRGPHQRENCWSTKDKTEFVDTAVYGWECPPIYIIQRPSEEENCDDDEETEELEDHIFDGAHKFEAGAEFIDGKYPIDGKSTFLSSLKQYAGKYFKDLPRPIRDKILNYQFTINYIDEATANNKIALKVLWERLNKGGQKLNDHELSIPVLHELIRVVLKPSSVLFFKSEIYPKEESKRGQIEKVLQMIIAITESNMADYASQFSSKKNLIKRWQDGRLGEIPDEITRRIEENKDKWLDILKRAALYLKFLSDQGTFVNDDGEPLLETAHRGTELVFLLGRLVARFPNPSEFRRLGARIGKKIKETYFLNVERDEAGRNGSLQRRLLKEIDAIVAEFTALNCPRLFTKDQIAQKYKDQGGMCALCKERVQKGQESGDHILPWSAGGTSELSNCQMTHQRCNSIKGDREDLTEFAAIPQ